MKPLACSQTLSHLIGEILPAANHSRDRFSRLMASMGNEEHLPIKEAERSHNDIAKLLRRALRVKLAAASIDGDAPWCDCIDFYPSTLVYMIRGIYYQAPYAIDEAGTVTIGEPVEVIPLLTYQPANPAAATVPAMAETSTEESRGEVSEIVGDCIDLTEAENFVNLQEAKATIRIATPGWGSFGYYSADVLKRDGPKIFPAGTQMFWNHPTESENAERPEGDLDRLAAVTTTPAIWQQNGKDGPGLYTTASLREKYAGDVAELKDHIGVSLRALGRFTIGKAEGKEGTIIEELVRGKSIDFVTRAGRGGKVLELFESAGRRQPATAAAESRKEVGEQMAMTPEETRQLQEATEAASAANATSNRLANELLLMRSERFVRECCESFSLPLAVRKRVIAAMASNPIVKNGAIDETPFTEAIKACISSELAYLKEAGVSGVSGFGSSTPAQEEAISLEEAEKLLNGALSEFKN